MTALGLTSLLAVPILWRGTLRGVLASGSTSGPRLGEGELRLAVAIAERAAPALDNASLWADLQEQVRREQRAQRIKDDFLSIVSHELRTPLTSIQGYAQLLEARMRDSAGAKELSQMRVIRSQVMRMRRLVDDLLDVSRIDRRGGVSVEPEPMDLAEEIREAAARTGRDHPSRTITVEAPEALPIVADRDRIGQVLTNLLDNAIKYSPDGGDVTVRANASPTNVEVAVLDEGVGISPDQADAVFERFFQADEDRGGRRFGGLGLGLYITRAIIQTHGGEIRAQPQCRGRPRNHDPLHPAAHRPRAGGIPHHGRPTAVRHPARLDSGACPPCAPSGRSPMPRSASPSRSSPSAFACPTSPSTVLAGRQVTDLTDLACPPYDVIGPDLQADLLGRHDHNAVRLELPPGDDPHAVGGLHAWHRGWRTAPLARRPDASVYYYAHASTAMPDDPTVQGVLARVLLEPYGADVRRHEHTMPGPKADRLALLRATRTQFSPILAVYFDRSERYRHVMSRAWTNEWRARDVDGLLHTRGRGRAGRPAAVVPVAPAAVHRRRAPSVRDRAGLPGRGAR